MRNLLIVFLAFIFLTSCKSNEEDKLEELGKLWLQQCRSADIDQFVRQQSANIEGVTPAFFESIANSTADPEFVHAEKLTTPVTEHSANYILTLDYNHSHPKNTADCAVIIYLRHYKQNGTFQIVSWNRCSGCG